MATTDPGVDAGSGKKVCTPSMYPGLMSMLDLPEFAPVELQPVDLHISCTFPSDQGETPF